MLRFSTLPEHSKHFIQRALFTHSHKHFFHLLLTDWYRLCLGVLTTHHTSSRFLLAVSCGTNRPPYFDRLLRHIPPTAPFILGVSALAEESSTAALSVSCWVSLFQGQELPALLLSPAHDNNTDRGQDTILGLKPSKVGTSRVARGITSQLYGAVVGL